MAFVQILSVSNHNGNNLKTGATVVDPSLAGATLRIDCTTGNPATPFTGFNPRPFNSTAMAISFLAEFSWDGGVTFPEQRGGTQNGSPTGIWAHDIHTGAPIMAPNVSIEIPDQPVIGRPTHYRGSIDVINGPITFGLSVQTF